MGLSSFKLRVQRRNTATALSNRAAALRHLRRVAYLYNSVSGVCDLLGCLLARLIRARRYVASTLHPDRAAVQK